MTGVFVFGVFIGFVLAVLVCFIIVTLLSTPSYKQLKLPIGVAARDIRQGEVVCPIDLAGQPQV